MEATELQQTATLLYSLIWRPLTVGCTDAKQRTRWEWFSQRLLCAFGVSLLCYLFLVAHLCQLQVLECVVAGEERFRKMLASNHLLVDLSQSTLKPLLWLSKIQNGQNRLRDFRWIVCGAQPPAVYTSLLIYSLSAANTSLRSSGCEWSVAVSSVSCNKNESFWNNFCFIFCTIFLWR